MQTACSWMEFATSRSPKCAYSSRPKSALNLPRSRALGLLLDHVNAHKHFHLHPTLLNIIVRIGREFGMHAIRVPDEPLWFSTRGAIVAGAANAALLAPWLAMMKRRLRAAGIAYNDRVFGVTCSGSMDEGTLLAILARLPPGVSEIYLHPAMRTQTAITSSTVKYRHADELDGLLSARVRNAVAATGAERGGYRDLIPAPAVCPMRRCRHNDAHTMRSCTLVQATIRYVKEDIARALHNSS